MDKVKKKNRHGVHADDLVQLAGYVTPELKALAQVTANELHTNVMELIRDGIAAKASDAGVMVNGQIVDKYKPIIAAYADAYRTRKAIRKQQKEGTEK